jgi:hypothetical protein
VTVSLEPEPAVPRPGVRSRHLAGAVVAGLAAGACVLVLSALYSVAGGFAASSPFQSIGRLLGFGGSSATAVGVFVDILIPIVAAFVMVVTLALLSRTRLFRLEFCTHPRALAEGGVLGLVIWAVFYVPVIARLSSHPTISSLASSLSFALFEHVAFGAVIGLVLFVVGGPVTFRRRAPAPAEKGAPDRIHERRDP